MLFVSSLSCRSSLDVSCWALYPIFSVGFAHGGKKSVLIKMTFVFVFLTQILSMIEEAAGTKMYETKKASAERTVEKKETKLQEIDTVSMQPPP